MADALSPLSVSTLTKSTPEPQPTPEVKKSAKDFESMLIGQLMAPMFEALKTDGMFGGGSGEEMFRPMLLEQYAKGITQAGGIGLADGIAREMMRMQAGKTAPESSMGAA
ncbi:MAG: rod-binding protein [Alphaproteobacteria bacterium]